MAVGHTVNVASRIERLDDCSNTGVPVSAALRDIAGPGVRHATAADARSPQDRADVSEMATDGGA